MAENEAAEAVNGAITGADAAQLAQMVGQIPDEQLNEAMESAEGRKLILDEIFNRMADHVEPRQVEGVDAVIHFRITGAPDGGQDVYEAAIKDGAVTVNNPPTSESPRVAITVAPVPFLKLVTGQQSGPVMFMTGKLKLDGDVMFAARITSFFRIPTASG